MLLSRSTVAPSAALVWLLLLLAGQPGGWRPVHGVSPHPVLCVLAFDGFRPDYVARGRTPTLERLSRQGVHAGYLRNVFPTKTFVLSLIHISEPTRPY